MGFSTPQQDQGETEDEGQGGELLDRQEAKGRGAPIPPQEKPGGPQPQVGDPRHEDPEHGGPPRHGGPVPQSGSHREGSCLDGRGDARNAGPTEVPEQAAEEGEPDPSRQEVPGILLPEGALKDPQEEEIRHHEEAQEEDLHQVLQKPESRQEDHGVSPGGIRISRV